MADGALASAAAAKQISLDDLDIAVIIPCMNEEIAIGGMVRKLRELLPHSRIFVYDNNSTDDTVGEAERAPHVDGRPRLPRLQRRRRSSWRQSGDFAAHRGVQAAAGALLARPRGLDNATVR